jgi:restriction system protein
MSEPTPVWLMRGGGRGEDEEKALEDGRAIIGFRDAGDLRGYPSVEAIAEVLFRTDKSPNEDRAATRARQLWAFSRSAKEGDVVVMPLKTQPGQIALGRLAGPYEYALIGEEKRHTRKVKWVIPGVPRSTFKQDLLYSLGAFLTVCRIQRNDASKRVTEVLAGRPDPGYEEANDVVVITGQTEATTDAAALPDLAQAAKDEIVAYIRRQFQAHDLARLVGAILEAEGYVINVSPPGPDGGADILAGRGPLGLDPPTLCVQVKATNTPVDVKVFRELVGTMDNFKADHGLLVCWSGFTQPLKQQARQQMFKVKLWDESDIVNAIFRVYEKLAPDIQAELPLKRVWTLVREDVSTD